MSTSDRSLVSRRSAFTGALAAAAMPFLVSSASADTPGPVTAMGNWMPGSSYVPNDVVIVTSTNGGGTWRCIVGNDGSEQPGAVAGQWEQWASTPGKYLSAVSDDVVGGTLTFDAGLVLGSSQLLVSPEAHLYAANRGATPQIFPFIDDNGVNGVCSVTVGNTGTSNRFGEFAMGVVEDGAFQDTYAFACDPDRNRTENFKLRHRGQDIFEVLPPDALHGLATGFPARGVRFSSDIVLGTTAGTKIGAEKEGGAGVGDVLRVAAGDRIILGDTITWAGLDIYPGTGELTVNAAQRIIIQDGRNIGLTIQGNNNQIAPLFEAKDVAGQTVFSVDEGGAVRGAGDVTVGGDVMAKGGMSIGGDIRHASGAKIGLYGAEPTVRPTVSGSRASGEALTSLLSALSDIGLITDESTP